MSSKEIKIRWISDESEIEKSLQRLQTKLQQMNKTSAQVQNITETGGTLSKRAQHAQKAFDKSSEALLQRESRELEQRQRKENLALLQKQRELNKLEKSEGRITAEKEKQLNLLKEEINLRAQKVMDIEVTKQDINTKLKGIQGGGEGAGRGGDVADTNPIKNILKQIGIATIIKKTIDAVGTASSEIYGNEARMSRQSGNIMQGMGDVSGFNQLYAGKGIENSFFGSQRMRAARQAGKEVQQQRVNQGLTVAGGAAAVTGGLAFAAGSAAPTFGVGTALGLGTAAAGFATMAAGHPRSRAGLRGKFLPEAGTEKEEIAKYEAETFVGDYRKNLEAEKKKDYFGQKGFQYLEGNRQGFLQSQRHMGMGDQELQGFLTDQSRGIFTQQEKLGASGAILGAGGSTAQAKESNQALAMERDYGIMSAKNVLGKISKGVEGEAVSDQAVNRILSEAVAAGLDTSKFAAELNKYVSITGDFIAASGAATPTEQARVAGAMNKFIGGRSMAELEAGKGARDQMNQMLGSGGGMFRKQLQIGAMMRHDKLKKLDPLEQGYIANTSPDTLRAGGEALEALSSKAGFENYDDFLNATLGEKGIKDAGRTLSGFMETKEEEFKKNAESAGVDSTIGINALKKMIKGAKTPERRAELEGLSQQRGLLTVQREMMERGGPSGRTKQQQQAFSMGNLGFGQEQGTPEGTFGVLAGDMGLEKRERGFGDIGREAQGRSEEALINKAFNPEIMDRYKKAGEHTIQTTDQAMGKWENFMNAVALGLDNVNEKAQELMKSLSGEGGSTPSVNEMNQFMRNLTNFGEEDSQPIMTRPPKAGK